MTREISQLRRELDEVDRELVALFERRMEISREVAAYKRGRGLPVLDAAREEQVLQSRQEMLRDGRLAAGCRALFQEIMRLSREEQDKALAREAGE